VSGVPGHNIEDISISNVRIQFQGRGTPELGLRVPPEEERSYPDPRHVRADAFLRLLLRRHVAGSTCTMSRSTLPRVTPGPRSSWRCAGRQIQGARRPAGTWECPALRSARRLRILVGRRPWARPAAAPDYRSTRISDACPARFRPSCRSSGFRLVVSSLSTNNIRKKEKGGKKKKRGKKKK